MPTSDAGTPRSLRLTAGLDTLTVSGLDETASETLCRDWSRCSPTPKPLSLINITETKKLSG